MQNKPVRSRLWTKAVFEHVSDHNFVHMMSTCQMQQILAKSDLYRTTSSTSSASIGSSGIKAHGINQTFKPPLLDNCNNSIANCFIPTIHKLCRGAAPLVNHNYKLTNTGRRSTLARTVISGNILPSQSRSTEGSKEAFSDWAVGLGNFSLAFLIDS